MKANTALGLVLAANTLWLLRSENPARAARVTGAVLAGVILTFALLTLAEYLAGIDLGIDHLFNDSRAHFAHPGRASPHTVVAFVAIGGWLIALALPGRTAARIRDVLSVIACLIVAQAAIGYLYGVHYLYAISGISGMAVHTMGTFIVLCLGILSARPRESFAGLLTSDGAGGHVARRLTPAVVFVPLTIGYLRLKAQQHGLFDTREGIAVLAGTTTAVLGAIVVYTCMTINRTDAVRRILELQLQALAERDPLTNLFNRRRFHEELEREVALARRHGTQVALIMIDLDRLKHINDTYGHRAGDEVLSSVAAALTDQLRATDTAARLGGDEFAVLLPNTSGAGAEAVAATLVSAIARTSCLVDTHTIVASVSAGVAISGDAPDPLTLVQAADKALYLAKDGRGRYTVAPPLSESSLDPA